MTKCKFRKKCPMYNEDSLVCTKDGGMYYEDGEYPAGCYRKMEKEDIKKKKYKTHIVVRRLKNED